MIRNRRVSAVFDRPSDAEKVKDELLEAGVARHRIAISGARMEVVARSPLDRDHIARVMLQHGARETADETSAALGRNHRHA